MVPPPCDHMGFPQPEGTLLYYGAVRGSDGWILLLKLRVANLEVSLVRCWRAHGIILATCCGACGAFTDSHVLLRVLELQNPMGSTTRATPCQLPAVFRGVQYGITSHVELVSLSVSLRLSEKMLIPAMSFT